MFCDLCCVGVTDCWTYMTPSRVTEAQALLGNGFWAEDEDWAVCGDCHALIEKGALVDLVKRSVSDQCQTLGIVRPDAEVMGQIADIIVSFWHHRRGEPYFETVAEHAKRAEA